MLLEIIQENLNYAVIALGLIIIVVLAISLVLLIKVNQTTQRYRTFMRGNTRANLEEHLFNYSKEVNEASEKMDTLIKTQIELNHTLKGCIQNIGVVRFDAYDDTGGQLSFALALMDGYGNGMVVSSLHGRDNSHVYAKPIRRGVSAYPLSQEEEQAIEQAIRNKLIN